MLREEVDEEDIAQIVAKWTGVPVTRLLQLEASLACAMRSYRGNAN